MSIHIFNPKTGHFGHHFHEEYLKQPQRDLKNGQSHKLNKRKIPAIKAPEHYKGVHTAQGRKLDRELTGFNTFNPNKDRNLDSPYTFSITNRVFVPSSGCYKQFKGDRYLTVKYRRKPTVEIAIMKSTKNDPESIYFGEIAHRQAYRKYRGHAMIHLIESLLAPRTFKGNCRYRVRADVQDVHSGFIIFKVDDKHIKQVNKKA